MSEKPVSARYESVTISTYPIGPGDPTPPIRRQWGYWRVHPYAMLDDLIDRREDRTYAALVLENEYLLLTVLPEIGGHLYAYDKVSGRDIFHRPQSIKPGLIALCGAWITGGIEFNFPCSHNPVTFRPVDHALRENADGSATIFIGAIEHLSRMRWTVGITLHPGVAVIDTDIRLENRTALPHRYYFWSNSSERVGDGTRFIAAATSVYGWEGIMRYPVHNGKYLPPYRDHKSPCDLFSRHVQADFFGCYDDEYEEGVVHYADHHVVTGRKYFTWGNSGDGLVWRHILSDGEDPYIEIQSGPFETQSIFKLMEPHQVMRWQETWYGVRKTGGFEFANRDVTLNLLREKSGAKVIVFVTRRIGGASVSVTAHDRVVGEWKGNLAPESPVEVALAGVGPDESVSVLVAAAEGRLAEATLPWRGVEDDLTDPVLIGPSERETVHGLASQGYSHEEQFEWMRARECYAKALEADPLALFPLTRLGILEIKAGRANEALALLQRAARVLPDSGEVNYYRGIALRLLGNRTEATEAFWRARLSPQFGALGRYMLGEMASEDGDAASALEHFRAAAEHEASGTKAWCGQVAMLRVLNRFDEAEALAGEMLRTDPLNPLLACERALLAKARGASSESAWGAAKELLRDEYQTWLELATDYAALGHLATALHILEQARKVMDSPLLHYYAAHYHERLGEREAAEQARLRAAALSADHVFPHRTEAEPVLREAMEKNPSDANAPYYLGTLLYMLGRTDEGRALWQCAIDRGCANASVYSCLGWVLWQADKNPHGARALFEKAVRLRPDDFRLYSDLDALSEQTGRTPEERLAYLAGLPESLRGKGNILSRIIRLTTLLERYDESIALLHAQRFNPHEGEMAMRAVYTDAYVGKGESLMDAGDHQGARAAFEKALEYPVHLGVGKPYRATDAPIYYRAGCACAAMGDADAAREHWRNGLAEAHHPIPSLGRYYVECCRWKLGELNEEGKTLAAATMGAILHALRTRQKEAKSTAEDLVLIGLVENTLGRSDEARAAFEEALRLSPWHQLARRELRRIQRVCGTTESHARR